MSQGSLTQILDALEANERDRLYEARWDAPAAEELVPLFVQLLASTDRVILLRTMRNLVTVGPLAVGALEATIPHLRSADPDVSDAAAIAVECLALRTPAAAVGPLMEAYRPGREKAILQALLGLGAAAGAAAPVFVAAYDHKSAGIRRLALRGLKAIEAPAATVKGILARVKMDKSREVREYARKLFG